MITILLANRRQWYSQFVFETCLAQLTSNSWTSTNTSIFGYLLLYIEVGSLCWCGMRYTDWRVFVWRPGMKGVWFLFRNQVHIWKWRKAYDFLHHIRVCTHSNICAWFSKFWTIQSMDLSGRSQRGLFLAISNFRTSRWRCLQTGVVEKIKIISFVNQWSFDLINYLKRNHRKRSSGGRKKGKNVAKFELG